MSSVGESLPLAPKVAAPLSTGSGAYRVFAAQKLADTLHILDTLADIFTLLLCKIFTLAHFAFLFCPALPVFSYHAQIAVLLICIVLHIQGICMPFQYFYSVLIYRGLPTIPISPYPPIFLRRTHQ